MLEAMSCISRKGRLGEMPRPCAVVFLRSLLPKFSFSLENSTALRRGFLRSLLQRSRGRKNGSARDIMARILSC